jgi:hypothetical protein
VRGPFLEARGVAKVALNQSGAAARFQIGSGLLRSPKRKNGNFLPGLLEFDIVFQKVR